MLQSKFRVLFIDTRGAQRGSAGHTVIKVKGGAWLASGGYGERGPWMKVGSEMNLSMTTNLEGSYIYVQVYFHSPSHQEVKLTVHVQLMASIFRQVRRRTHFVCGVINQRFSPAEISSFFVREGAACTYLYTRAYTCVPVRAQAAAEGPGRARCGQLTRASCTEYTEQQTRYTLYIRHDARAAAQFSIQFRVSVGPTRLANKCVTVCADAWYIKSVLVETHADILSDSKT